MSDTGWLGPALGAAVVGLATSLPLRAALANHTYRYDDEQHLPARRHHWVPPLVTVATFAVAARSWSTLPAVAAVTILLTYAVVVPLLATLCAIDLDVHRLPDRLTRLVTAVAAAGVTLSAAATGDWSALGRAVLAGLALTAAYLAAMWCSPQRSGLGLGDVKLAPALGVLLGWVSWPAVATGTLLAFVGGGLWAAYLLITRRARGSDRFAFGPFMVAGALGAILLEAP